MAKVKVATEWLAGCAGCHMSILDIDERIVALSELIEIVSGPLVDAKHVPEVDVAIIEGGITNSSNLANLMELRERAKVLIALGDCAMFGGVPAMRNIVGKEAALKHAYCESPNCFGCGIPNDPELATLEDTVTGLGAHVKVDLYIPGCPPSADTIFTALSELLAGRIPELSGDLLKYD